MPEHIAQAITFHHNPRMPIDMKFDVTAAVYVANILVHQVSEDYALREEMTFDADYLKGLKIYESIDEWFSICKQQKDEQGGADELL